MYAKRKENVAVFTAAKGRRDFHFSAKVHDTNTQKTENIKFSFKVARLNDF